MSQNNDNSNRNNDQQAHVVSPDLKSSAPLTDKPFSVVSDLEKALEGKHPYLNKKKKDDAGGDDGGDDGHTTLQGPDQNFLDFLLEKIRAFFEKLMEGDEKKKEEKEEPEEEHEKEEDEEEGEEEGEEGEEEEKEDGEEGEESENEEEGESEEGEEEEHESEEQEEEEKEEIDDNANDPGVDNGL